VVSHHGYTTVTGTWEGEVLVIGSWKST